jgi:hypothetical protein
MIGQIFQDFYLQGHRKRLFESDRLAKTQLLEINYLTNGKSLKVYGEFESYERNPKSIVDIYQKRSFFSSTYIIIIIII